MGEKPTNTECSAQKCSSLARLDEGALISHNRTDRTRAKPEQLSSHEVKLPCTSLLRTLATLLVGKRRESKFGFF